MSKSLGTLLFAGMLGLAALNRWRLTPGFDSQFAPSLQTTV